MSGKRGLIGAAVLVISLAGCARPANDAAPRARDRDIELANDARVIEDRVPANTTLAGLLFSHQLDDRVVHGIIDAARSVFDPRRLRAEHPYRLELGLDGVLRHFTYEIDTDRFLRVVGLGEETGRHFEAEIVPYPKSFAQVAVSGAITSDRPSLVAAVAGVGEQVPLALSMADLFSSDIDFNSELQVDDRFEVLVDKVLREGEVVGYGDIRAAQFVNGGRAVSVFRYQVPGEKAGYYDAEGRSIRRQFLKSPLKFDARITSGFSRRRMHPILGRYRAHLAVDYGAPTGAPVVAVANGVVVRAGYAGDNGNLIVLRHTGGYETYYLHLSAITPGVRPGARVGQGEIIGKVGKTGLATAPHLDYRLRKDGQFVNPITAHLNMPPGPPIPADHLAAFLAERDRALARFVSPAPLQAAQAADPTPTTQ